MAQQRHEMYRPIHKAIRHMMYTTAHSLSVADFQDKPLADGGHVPSSGVRVRHRVAVV